MKMKTYIRLVCLILIGIVQCGCQRPPGTEQSKDRQIAQGRELYLSHGCGVCHGENGDGKSIVPQKLKPPAIDFHDPSAYRYGHDRNSIKASIKRGAKQPGSVMPSYDHLSNDELDLIAAYVESLVSVDTNRQIMVSDAWVRFQPPSRPNSAAFMTIENKSLSEMILVSVFSPVVERIELHAVEHEAGIMKMRQMDSLTVPAQGTVELKSGGFHLMLFGISKPLEQGEFIPLVLKFNDGSVYELQALVKGLDEE